MSDRNDGTFSMNSQGETARRGGSTVKGGAERGMNVLPEFLDAARFAAESLLEEQKRRASAQVSGIAGALRSAAHSLEQSQNRAIWRYVHEAAEQIESLSRTVHERRWNEIVADTEDFARRQPALFVIGAVAAGFLIGRFLWASTGSQRHEGPAIRDASRSEAARAVTAAVSSGSGTGTIGVAGDGVGSTSAPGSW